MLKADPSALHVRCRLWESMGLELQPDLCSLLIKDVIYHEEAVRQAGAEALSRAVAQYRNQAAEVMNKLTEIYQEKLYVSPEGLTGTSLCCTLCLLLMAFPFVCLEDVCEAHCCCV